MLVKLLGIMTLLLLMCSVVAKKKKVHKSRPIKIEYEYLPQGYKDPATVICTKPTTPSKGRLNQKRCLITCEATIF